jgi:hypothetical protein
LHGKIADLAVRLFLGPSWRRVFKILLASVGRRIEMAVRVVERFSATSVRRIGVKKIIIQTKKYALVFYPCLIDANEKPIDSPAGYANSARKP